MIEAREREINGHIYMATQLTVRRALRLQYKLMKIFSPSVSRVLNFNVKEGTTMVGMNINIDAIPKALADIFSYMDENTYDSIISEIIQGVRRDGIEMTPGTVDMDFRGDLVSLMKVIWFVLEINFDSFFGQNGFGSLLEKSAE